MAATTTATKRTTVEELWALRDEPYRLALIDGELRRMPGVGMTHGRIAIRCGSVLDDFVAPRGLGVVCVETGFRLFPTRQTTLFPDVAFVRTDRLPPESEQDRFVTLAPDLAVEIASPFDEPKDAADKLASYLEAGVPEIWWMYPATKSLVVHGRTSTPIRLSANDLLDGGELLPEFRVRVADLFERPKQSP